MLIKPEMDFAAYESGVERKRERERERERERGRGREGEEKRG